MSRKKKREINKEWEAFFGLLRESEKRVAAESPYYMAKFVMGRHWWREGRSEGWSEKHRELSDSLWGLYRTRRERSYGTYYALIWPRGTRKSTVGNSAFAVCAILDDPNIRIMLDTDKLDNAQMFLEPIKSAFEDKLFQELYGDLRGKIWKRDAIEVSREATLKEPTVFCSGVDAEKTGLHCEIILSDDIQTDGNSQSRDQTERVIRNFKLYDSLLDKGGMCVLPMTTWNYGDLSEYIQKVAKEDEKFKRPRRIHINKKSAYRKTADGKFDYDTPEFPEILDRDTLNFKRGQQGGFVFSCQYLCEPTSDDTAWFKKEWFQYFDESPEELVKSKKMNIYVVVDPAGEGNFEGADYNVVMTVGITPTNDIYVLKYTRKHQTRDELLDDIIKQYQYFGARKVAVEKAFKQYELERWMKQKCKERNVHLIWHDLKITHQVKEHRIRQLQPYFENGKVKMREEMYELQQELVRYPKSKHDDVSDCLANSLDFITAPPDKQPREWWRSDNWSDEFKPTADREEEPDARSVAAWRELEKVQGDRSGRRRLIPLSRAR